MLSNVLDFLDHIIFQIKKKNYQKQLNKEMWLMTNFEGPTHFKCLSGLSVSSEALCWATAATQVRLKSSWANRLF